MKPQLHVSDLGDFCECGVRFAFKKGHLFKLTNRRDSIRPSTTAQAIGTATHKAVELDMKHKIATGELLDLGAVKAAARDEFCRIEEAEGLRFQPEETLNTTRVIGASIDQAVRLAALHHTAIAPHLNPIYAEKKWVITMKGYDIDLAGKIDVIDQQPGGEGEPPRIIIRDVKTVTSMPADNACQTLQMAAYCMAWKVSESLGNGSFPDGVAIDALVKGVRSNRAKSILGTPKESWLLPLLGRIEHFVAQINAAKKTGSLKVLTPAPADGPNSWVCSKAHCEYWDECRLRMGAE